MITFLITGFNSFWNSSSIWFTFANYQDNNSHNELHFVLKVYIHLIRYPLSSYLRWVWHPFVLMPQQCLAIKLVSSISAFCRNFLNGRVSQVFLIWATVLSACLKLGNSLSTCSQSLLDLAINRALLDSLTIHQFTAMIYTEWLIEISRDFDFDLEV